MSPAPEWPEPRHDPATEKGEDPETHLLPNLDRLRSMSRHQRQELIRLVRDWEGPLVEELRRRVAEL